MKRLFLLVALLIFTLSLGVVSASEDVDVAEGDVSLSASQEVSQVEIADDSPGEPLEDMQVTFEENDSASPPSGESKSIISTNNGNNHNVVSSGEQLDVISQPDVIYYDAVGITPFEGEIQAKVIESDGYGIAFDITTAACALLNVKSADDILVITNAGLSNINDAADENILNGIIDASNGFVSYDNGNLLTLSSLKENSINIAFFKKEGESLTLAFYKNGALTPVFYGNVGSKISAGLWSKLQDSIGYDITYYMGFANSWANGISKDVIWDGSQEHFLCGFIGEQAKIQILLKNYPPANGLGLPHGDIEYYLLGGLGNSNDNAFIWSLDQISGKEACIGVDSMVNKSVTGFIRWNNTSQTGMLIIMSLNLNTFSDNITSLVEVLYELDGLTYDDLYNLMGNTKSGLLGASMLKSSDFKQIGVDASNMALNYFSSHGIDTEKGYLYILTSAGYVKVNGASTQEAVYGILEVFDYGYMISTDTPWKDLVFYFLWVNNTNSKDYLSYCLKYDAATGKLIVSQEDREQGDYLAYVMGLYEKLPVNPTKNNGNDNLRSDNNDSNSNISEYVLLISKALKNAISFAGQYVNNASSENSTNDTAVDLSSKTDSEVIQKLVMRDVDPFNILYTLAAIFLVVILFRVGYTKRD